MMSFVVVKTIIRLLELVFRLDTLPPKVLLLPIKVWF
jgi:hypothetical protein